MDETGNDSGKVSSLPSPLAQYLINRKESVNSFARRSGIATSTIYPIYYGRKPQRRIAVKICRYAKEIDLSQFGYSK